MNERLRKILDGLLAKVPEIIIATIVALTLGSFNLWLSARDARHDIDEIRADVVALEQCARGVATHEQLEFIRDRLAQLRDTDDA